MRRLPPSLRTRALHASARWPPDPYVELDHAAWAMEEILRDPVGFDVIHAHVAAAVPFARFVDTPMVYTVHHDRHAAPYARLWDTMYRRATVRFVCISERQRRLSPELARATVIRHGLEPSLYELGNSDGDYAAFLGRLDRCKGVHHAIEAADRAQMMLAIGGEPHQDERYFETVVRPRVDRTGARLLGSGGGRRKIDFLRGARALLFPVGWEEPFGLVMIEAMLCGTPIIAFPGVAVEEVVEDGVTGWVVRSVDEMASRLRAARRFDRPRCRLRAVERWSTRRMVEDHERLYAELSGRKQDERRGAAAPLA